MKKVNLTEPILKLYYQIRFKALMRCSSCSLGTKLAINN